MNGPARLTIRILTAPFVLWCWLLWRLSIVINWVASKAFEAWEAPR